MWAKFTLCSVYWMCETQDTCKSRLNIKTASTQQILTFSYKTHNVYYIYIFCTISLVFDTKDTAG